MRVSKHARKKTVVVSEVKLKMMGGKPKSRNLHCRNLLLRHLGEFWDRSVAEMGDKGGKDAGPIAVALGVAALGWAWGAIATRKANRSAQEAHKKARQARQALRAHLSSGPDLAGLRDDALGLAEQYKEAQQEYTRLLRLQPQAGQVRSRVNHQTLQCKDQHVLLEVHPFSSCLNRGSLNVCSGVCKGVCVIEVTTVGLWLLVASTPYMSAS